MTVLRLLGATLTSATASLVCVVTLPLVGIDTTAGLWLTTLGIAAGLLAICAAVLAMVALLPPQPLTAPQEPQRPSVRVSVVRDALPAATRPVKGAIELPAGSVS